MQIFQLGFPFREQVGSVSITVLSRQCQQTFQGQYSSRTFHAWHFDICSTWGSNEQGDVCRKPHNTFVALGLVPRSDRIPLFKSAISLASKSTSANPDKIGPSTKTILMP